MWRAMRILQNKEVPECDTLFNWQLLIWPPHAGCKFTWQKLWSSRQYHGVVAVCDPKCLLHLLQGMWMQARLRIASVKPVSVDLLV